MLVSIPLGWAAVLAHLVFLLGAWSYNAGLKGTPISVLPYLVSFGILPTVVTLSAAQPAVAPWWAMAAGALLGAGAHFANVLPDLDDDARTGIRGLPHRLGRVPALIVTWLALLAAAASLAVGIGLDTPLGIDRARRRGRHRRLRAGARDAAGADPGAVPSRDPGRARRRRMLVDRRGRDVNLGASCLVLTAERRCVR